MVNPLWKSLRETLTFKGEGKYLILLVPHSNEPLGLLTLSDLYDECEYCLNTDIGNKESRFDLPCNFYEFMKLNNLPPLEEQVEFSYTKFPNTKSEHRSYQIYKKLESKKLVISIHNDPSRSFFYAYTQENIPFLNDLLMEANHKFLKKLSINLRSVSYTKKNNSLLYSYFNTSALGLKKNNSFGSFCQMNGIRAISIEVPMFDWNKVKIDTYRQLIQGYFLTVKETNYHKKSILIAKYEEKAKEVKMIDLNILTLALNFIIQGILERAEHY